jgi:hypothetical protein
MLAVAPTNERMTDWGVRFRRRIVGLLVFLAGCRGLSPSLLEAGSRPLRSLPPLNVEFVHAPADPYFMKPLGVQLAEDMRRLLDEELRRNVFLSEKPALPHGTIDVSYEYSCSVNPIWLVPSALTLTSINLLGFPYGSTSIEVTLRVELRDVRDRGVRSYNVTALDTVYTAYYWGYAIPVSQAGVEAGTWEGVRLAHARAAHQALELLEDELWRDATGIRAALAAADDSASLSTLRHQEAPP